MILPDFILPEQANQRWYYSGIDSLENCLDKQHFKSYPYDIGYVYNSRGFRDTEWPDNLTDLQDAIWCLGDSFTVGIGCPVEHTWPYIIQQQTTHRTINISMDGASNKWISRKAVDLLQHLQPKIIVLHWSYTHRRELEVQEIINTRWKNYYNDVRDSSWPDCPPTPDQIDCLPKFIQDEILKLHGSGWASSISDKDRRLNRKNTTAQEDVDDICQCIHAVDSVATGTKIIHSVIPKFHSTLLDTAQWSCNQFIPEFNIIDFARDHYHYDVKTATKFVESLVPLIT